MVIAAEGSRELVIASVSDIPLTHHGRVSFQVENVISAVAAAWSLGISDEAIRQGLETFDSHMDVVPGRFNVIDVNGATLVLDFGHNPSAMIALAQAMDRFPHARRLCVLSADGDRSDQCIVRQAELLGHACDEFILYEEPARQRGRGDGEIYKLLQRGLSNSSRASRIREVTGEIPAIQSALDQLRPGLLLLIIHDNVERSLAFVRQYLNDHCGPVNESERAQRVSLLDLRAREPQSV
jgi:cyanophycin synthetase